ncbi:MAG: phosphate regulon sensor histidine kinase PhoR [Agarilytica sp.]
MKELRWLSLLLCGALIVGYSVKAVAVCLTVTLLGYIGFLLYRMKELESWVTETRRKRPPSDDFGGVVGEIADEVRLICRRFEKDKVRLQAIVNRVQEMTSALNDAVILVDSRGNIEWWNRTAQVFFAFQNIDLGHKLVNFIRSPKLITYFESQDFSQPIEVESPRKEGQRLQFHVHPFGHGERLIVVRDVTRVKRLEQMRKDFVSNVSHELRTPLTVIKGYIETLVDAPDVSPTWQNALKQMLQQSDRMADLVNDLITLSRLETDEAADNSSSVQLDTLVQAIILDAKILSEGRHNFICDVEKGLKLFGNDNELYSAISNLVFNAVKYSPNGGHISIRAKVNHEGCIISVNDQGKGIDAKHLPRITERFYRIDEGRASNMGGTGLGLAIVKHALMKHDAELKVESILGKGSTFICRFPKTRIVSEASVA